MEELQEKLSDLESRTESVLEDLTELEGKFEARKGEEGTVKARMKEAVVWINKGKRKLENAISLTEF